jgi:isocitrate dehydrogenase
MNNKRIIFQDGNLKVPDFPVIPFIEGDGIGTEITIPTIKTINVAIDQAYSGKRQITWKELLAGEKAHKLTGEWLPAETPNTLKEHLVALKGPLTTPVGGGYRSLNVALRQALDLYACVRPVQWFKGVPSPLKQPEQVNLVIFRENTEDVYTGIEFPSGEPETRQFENFIIEEHKVNSIRFPGQTAYAVKPVSRPASERLVRAAIRYAIKNNAPSVTLVHKGNIMKYTEGAFRQWGYEVAEKEFGNFCQINKKSIQENSNQKIIVKDLIADAFFQDLLCNPDHYSVIATLNLNGDYLSDLAAAMVGGVGIAPGANINYETGQAIFEATHGTAPDIVGMNQANPTSLLLSGAMLLEYLNWTKAAILLRNAIRNLFHQKIGTTDLFSRVKGAQVVGTSEFLYQIQKNIKTGLKSSK